MSSFFAGFDVRKINSVGTLQKVASPTVSIYDVTNSASLGTVAADAHGTVSSGSLSVSPGTLVRFSVSGYAPVLERTTTSTPVYSGIRDVSLVIENLYTPPVSDDVEFIDIWIIEGASGEPRKVGTVPLGGVFNYPYNPATDANLQIYAISRSSQGASDVFDIQRAVRYDVNPNRETLVPVIFQATDPAATNTALTINVTNYSILAKFRKTRVAFNNTFTQGLQEFIDNVQNQALGFPATKIITRSTDATYDTDLTLAKTKYVEVSHSSNGIIYGTPSNILSVTYPTSAGTGGTGGGTPPPTGAGNPPKDFAITSESTDDDGVITTYTGSVSWANDGATGTNILQQRLGAGAWADTSYTANATATSLSFSVTEDSGSLLSLRMRNTSAPGGSDPEYL